MFSPTYSDCYWVVHTLFNFHWKLCLVMVLLTFIIIPSNPSFTLLQNCTTSLLKFFQ